MGNRLTPEQLEALRRAMGQSSGPAATPANLSGPAALQDQALPEEEMLDMPETPDSDADTTEESLQEAEQELEEEKVSGAGPLGFNVSSLTDPRQQEGSPERAEELLRRTAEKERQKNIIKDAEMKRRAAQRQKRQQAIARAQELGISPERLGLDPMEDAAELEAAQEASETLDYMGQETPVEDPASQPEQFQQEPPQVDLDEVEEKMQAGANEAAEKAGAQQTEQDIYTLKQQKALQEYEEASNKMQELEAELSDEPLDSGRLWKNMSTGKKILLAISAAVSGYGYGLAGRPEKAGTVASMVERAIDQDLEMQMQDRQNKRKKIAGQKDIMGMALNKFKTMTDAKLAAKNAILRKAELGMQQQLNNARTAQARASTLKAISDLQNKRQENQKQLELSTMLNSGQPMKESQVKSMIQYLPEDMRERYVPGMGFATTKKMAENLQNENASMIQSLDIINKLQTVADKPLEDWSPELRGKSSALLNALAGKLRITMTGGGPLTVEERKMIKNTIGDPSKLFGLDYVEKAKLDQMEDILRGTVEAKKKASIIQPIQPDSEEDMESLENMSLQELRQYKQTLSQGPVR